jgi:GAF domain-containing protein/HAMP domain-containing protein
MNPKQSRFNILSWPIWLKLLAGLVLALLILVIPGVIFIRSGVFDVGLQNARSFVSETGSQQLSSISNTLTQARISLENFTSSPSSSRQLTGMLLRGVRSQIDLNLPQVTPADIEALFQQALLDNPATLFDNVRLLDRDGQLIAQAARADQAAPVTVPDESQSAAYLTALAAQTEGQYQTLSVSTRGTEIIELVHALRWRDGRVIGYVIATLSNQRAIYNNIQFRSGSDSLPAYTFLTTEGGLLFSLDANRSAAFSSLESAAVIDALDGQSGIQVYEIGTGEAVLGYHAPVAGTPLALVTQVPTEAAYQLALRFFNVRAFVVAIGVLVLVGILVLGLNQLLVPPIQRLRKAVQALQNGRYDEPLDVERQDELGALASEFAVARDQVSSVIQDLETRVASRTRDIGATQDISRYAATQRDLQTLMDRVVGLITERFPNIYHAQIFLLDSEREYAMLRASTGAAGKQLLARGHRLGVGSISVIGQVTQTGQLVVARDTEVSQVHRRNEFLPDTRAELAIPLKIGDTVIGALDVQSVEPATFNEDQINVLQTMADQIAIAIQNARLYEESLRRMVEVEESNRQATMRAWQDYMREQHARTLTSTAGYQTETPMSDLRQQALETGKAVVGTATERDTLPIAVPVRLRGQTLGAVEWEVPVTEYNDDKLELAQELANRLALSLDNARLFQESQRAAERERVVNSIAAKLTAQTEIDAILQTAVREVGQALRAPQVSIRLGTREPQPDELLPGAPSSVDEQVKVDGAGRYTNGSNGTHP